MEKKNKEKTNKKVRNGIIGASAVIAAAAVTGIIIKNVSFGSPETGPDLIGAGITFIAPSDSDTHKGIIYMDPTDLTKQCSEEDVENNVNSQGTKTGVVKGCMKWYVYDETADTYKVILDHNTNPRVLWDTNYENVALENSAIKDYLDRLVNNENWKVTPSIISAEEIANIIGKTDFDATQKNITYLDTKSNSIPTHEEDEHSKYDWLFNNLNSCISQGHCTVEDNNKYSTDFHTEDSLDLDITDSYWTKTTGVDNIVWFVRGNGFMSYYTLSPDLEYINNGIRPVVEVDKYIYITSDDVQVSLDNLEYTGSEIKPAITITYSEKNLASGTDYVVSYSNNTAAGTASLNITCQGNYKCSIDKNFEIKKAPSTNPTLTDYAGIYNGEEHTIGVTGGTGGTIMYSTDNTNWTEELPTATDIGTTAIYVKVSGDSNHTDSTVITGNISITPKDITTVNTILETTSYTYTGSEITPAITLIDEVLNKHLTEGTDYTITYTDNVNSGAASLTINGTGNYHGTITKNFTIEKATPVITVDPTNENITYGKIKTFSASTTVAGSWTVASSDDTLVGIEDARTSTDKKSITVIYKGKSFYATGAQISITFEPDNENYKNNSAIFSVSSVDRAASTAPEIKGYSGTYDGDAHGIELVSSGTGGTVMYKTKQDNGSWSSETDVLPTRTDVGTTEVMAYVKGDNNHNDSDPVYATITITARKVELQTVPSNLTYNGEIQTVILEGDYFTLEGVSSAIDVGEYTVIATLKSPSNTYWSDNTTAAKTYNWKINPYTINVSWDSEDLFTYNKTAQAPTLTTIVNGVRNEKVNLTRTTKISANTETEWSYTSEASITSVENGQATSTNYILSNNTKNFRIGSKSINDSTIEISLTENEFTYNGEELKPSVIVVDTENGMTTLTEGTDYTISYTNNKDAGTATVSITGKGNYKDAILKNFTINRRTLNVVADTTLEKIYDEVDPALTYTFNNNVAGEMPGFSGVLQRVASNDIGTYNIEKGTLTLVNNESFKATNYEINYTGATLKINPKPINDNDFTITLIDADSYIYDGNQHKPNATVTDISNNRNRTLANNSEFNLTYTNNINAGDATVIITGTGNYTGNVTKTFTIGKRALKVSGVDNHKVFDDADPTFAYNVTNLVTGETAKFSGSLTRVAGENVGEYIINQGTLTQIDNAEFLKDNYVVEYTEAKFTVIPKSIQNTDSDPDDERESISHFTPGLDNDKFTYDGTRHQPNTTLKDDDKNKSLELDTDYIVTYANNKDAGTALVTLTGKGNYKDSITIEYTIEKRDVTVTADSKEKTFEEEDENLTHTDTNVVEDETLKEITVTRNNGENAGAYEIKATEKKEANPNYNITFVAGTYTIKAKDVTNKIRIDLEKNMYSFDNKEKTPSVKVYDKETDKEIPASEYKVEYSDNKNVGVATVTIKDNKDGNYIVSGSTTFKIVDTKEPLINGATDGENYYEEKTLEFSDDVGVTKVTDNGVEVELNNGKYIVKQDNKEHTIQVSDETGNTTTIKLSVYQTYTVTYIADGNTVKTFENVYYGSDITDIPEIPRKVGYDQVKPKWDKEATNITDNIEVNAIYTKNVAGSYVNTTADKANYGNAAITVEDNNLKDLVTFTNNEKYQMSIGLNGKVYLEVKDIESTITPEEKELIKNALASEMKIGAYLDINLYKQLGNNNPVKVEKTNKVVEVVIDIPENLINNDSSVTRIYSIIKVHNGKVEIIDTTEKDGKLYFETEEFSTYAIAYTDVKTKEVIKIDDKEERPVIEKSNTEEKTTNVMPIILIAAISLVIIAIIILLAKNKRKNNNRI